MSQHEEIIKQTEKMLSYLNKIDETFETIGKKNVEVDFFQVVKPFADEVKQFSDRWCEIVSEWVDKHHPRNLFPQQIESARDNIQEISASCFFPQPNPAHFKHTRNSVHYILEKVLVEVKKVKSTESM